MLILVGGRFAGRPDGPHLSNAGLGDGAVFDAAACVAETVHLGQELPA